MTKVLANWILASRANAFTTTAVFTLLGLLFPPLLLLGMAALALVCLRNGIREGLVILLSSAVFILLASFIAQSVLSADALPQNMISIVGVWVLVILLAQVYRHYAQTAWMINAAALVGLILVGGAYWVLGDPAQYWLSWLEQNAKLILTQVYLEQDQGQLEQLLSFTARIMTGAIAVMICLALVISILLARWWQAVLFNPGGFQKEFHQLRLGRLAAWIMLMLIGLTLLGQFRLTTDMATVVWLMFFFQGIAVLHALVGQMGIHVGWLALVYLLMIMMPYYTTPILSGLGLIDNWFDFRSRLANRLSPPDNNPPQ